MAALTDRDPGDETNAENVGVLNWRLEELERAGWPVDLAIMLSERSDVDLHLACELLEHGATIHEALRILT